MSKKSLLGIDLTEWNTLSGLTDPYSLELAKISAEAGVPRIAQLSEDADTDRDPHHGMGGEEGNAKRRDRLVRLRGGRDPLANKGPQDAMNRYLRKKGKTVREYVSFDDCLDAYLEDHGSSLREFNMLLSLAIESDDWEMQAELFASEDDLDAILEAGFVQKGKDMFKKAADSLSARAEKGRQAGFAASQKSSAAAAPGGAAPKAPTGAPAPAPAAAAAPPPAATPSDAGTAAGTPPPAPTPGAPAPGAAPAKPAAGAAPTPGAPAPGAAKPAVGTTGGNTDQTAPSQPGQTEKPKKDPLNPGGMSTGQKLAQGTANLAVSAPTQLAKGIVGKIKKAGSAMKKGFKGEDVDYWEEFLGENDLTIEEYLSVVEQAYEYGDDEMIEEVHQLDEIFAAWQAKRQAKAQAKSDDHTAKMKGKWNAATNVIKKHGKQAVKDASNRGVDLPKRVAAGGGTSTNETMDWMLQMSGYTDEYIAEGRSKYKDRQMAGARASFASSPGQNADYAAQQSDYSIKKAVRGGGRKNDPLETLAKSAKKQGISRVKMSRSAMKADPGYALSTDGGKQRPKLPEAMEKMLQMAGYTDEYIEARTSKSAEKKARQYQGLTKSNSDDFISKQASRKRGKSLVKLVDDPANKLAPQLVRTLRRTRK